MALVCLMLLTLRPRVDTVSAQDASTVPVPPVDLAAIALNPLDIAAFGLQPYGSGDGRYFDKSAAARLISEIYNRPPAAVEPVLATPGFIQGYTLTNDNLTPPGAIGSELNGLIQSTILELPDDAAATGLFDSLKSMSGAMTIPDAEQVGNASVLVSFAAGGNESPSSQGTMLTFHTGNVVAWVLFTARSVLVDVAGLTTSLSVRLLDKVGIVQSGSAPGLSYRFLGFQNVAPVSASYAAAYGEILRFSEESDAAFQTRTAEDAGVRSDYRQTIDFGKAGSSYTLATALVTFDTVERANVRFTDAAPRVERLVGVSGIVAAADAPAIGDASTTISYQRNDGNFANQTSILSGQTVLTLELRGRAAAPASALERIAAVQVACLTSNTACAPLAIPAELRAGSPPALATIIPASSTPVERTVATVISAATISTQTACPAPSPVTASATADNTSAASPLSMSAMDVATPEPPAAVYRNENYPFTISYDQSTWSIAQQADQNNRSYILFRNKVSFVYFIAGKSYNDDINACLRDDERSLSKEPGVTAVAPEIDSKGTPVARSSKESASSVYTYTTVDGIPSVRYVECVVLVPGEPTLMMVQIVTRQSSNDQVELHTSLIRGLRIFPTP